MSFRHRFAFVEAHAGPPPSGFQYSAANHLRVQVEAKLREAGAEVHLCGSAFDQEDLQLVLPCRNERIMLLRFLPAPQGTRVQFYLPLATVPGFREMESLAASCPADTGIVLACCEGFIPAVMAEILWRGQAEDLVPQLALIGGNLRPWLDLEFGN
jgi:hypothetical protein